MEEVIYNLKLFNLLLRTHFDDATMERCIEACETCEAGFKNPDVPMVEAPITEIKEVVDGMLKIAIVRDADKVTHDTNNCFYNKNKYKFDACFTGANNNNDAVFSMIEFLNKRIEVQKSSSVLTMGFSKSGKTTLIKALSGELGAGSYRLFEIYNNKLYGYYKGSKTEADNIDDEKFTFKSNDITSVMDSFARKKDNGTNSMSSRSHIILICYFTGCSVTLYDLAGNEKYKTTSEKSLLDETKYINQSLYNVSRFLKMGNKYKDGKCVLLQTLKKVSNFIVCVLLNDNNVSKASTFLMLLRDILH